MSYLIAIVEDEDREVELLQTHLKNYGNAMGLDFVIDRYASADVFLFHYRSSYDIVFLDIMMPGINGMDAAVRLRELDQVTTIIFVTNMAQYAVKGYAVQAFDFLLKPVSYAAFSLTLQRAINHLSQNKDEELLVARDGKISRIRKRSIRYIEVSDHTLLIHADGGALEICGNLKQMEAQLDPTVFVRCNSCYLVNLNYVRNVTPTTVMAEDTELQMSRPKRKAFMAALNDYLGGNN